MSVLDWLAEPWHSTLVAKGGLTALLVGVPAAGIGCWVILRDLPYAAESLAHGMFPGLVAAALVGVPLLVGGLAGLGAAAAAIALARRAEVEAESAVAVAVTPLIGLGAILALAGDTPPGADSFLFGDILATSTADAVIAACFAAAAIAVLRVGHWRFVASGVAPMTGRSTDLLVLALLAAATVAAARSLGALLAVALIIGPAATAMSTCRRAGPMVVAAMAFAALAIPIGIELSWHADLATGPSIAICAIIPAAVAGMARRLPVSRTARRNPTGNTQAR